MGYIRGKSRYQGELISASLDEQIEQTNPIRVIDAFIDSVDERELGITRARPAETGRPAYAPKDLLKLYLYGYMNRIRSSRRLMNECRRNIELFWLMNHVTPDFRTIADFRKDNSKAIAKLFREFVKACDELSLLRKELFVVDGTKIRAVNSIKRSYTPEVLERKLQYIEEQERQLTAYLSQMDAEDEKEHTPEIMLPKEDVENRLTAMRKRAQKYRSYQQELKETGKKQILETDPEAYTMHTKDGLHPCYNIQTAVDGGSHLIVEYATTNLNNDQGLLHMVSEQTKETLALETLHAVADKGYESRQDIEACFLSGVMPDVGFKYDKEERVHTLEHVPTEIDEVQRCSAKPEDIKACLHAGVLPQCYEGSNLRVEIQELSEESCFLRHEDGRVTCPMGHEMYLRRALENGAKDYCGGSVCRTCTNRCTDSKKQKQVRFGPDTVYVPVRIYGESRQPLQKPPYPLPHQPGNNYGKLQRAKGKVMIYIKRDVPLQKRRMELSEHPFGTVKWADGAHYFLCRGKEKVNAEAALAFLSYNLRRAIQIAGTAMLISHFRKKIGAAF